MKPITFDLPIKFVDINDILLTDEFIGTRFYVNEDVTGFTKGWYEVVKDGTTLKWEYIPEFTDFDVNAPRNGEVFVYQDGKWTNKDLKNMLAVTSASTGKLLTYTADGFAWIDKWIEPIFISEADYEALPDADKAKGWYIITE